MEQTTTALPPAGGVPQRARRGDLLTTFGLLVVAVIVAALGTTSLVLVYVLRSEARARVVEGAPALMNLFSQTVREAVADGPTDRLGRVLSDLTRVPKVQSCRLTLAQTTGSGPASFSAVRPGAANESVLNLRSEILDNQSRLLATLEVGYGTADLPAVPGIFWTATGTTAIAALSLFWLIYRVASERVRPISYVQENLLAYHRGHEQALELLAVRDESAHVAKAWNGLLEFVRGLQQQLDEYHSREAVATSAQFLHGHSSRAILDSLPAGVLRVGGDDRLMYANVAATQLLRLSTSDDNAPLAGVLSNDALREQLLSLRSTAGGGFLDVRLEADGGHTVLRLARVPHTGDAQGELVVLVQDVSQLKEAERMREEFLDHITHELRTPLTNIRAYTETLTEDFFDDEQTRRECYNVIMSETRRLSKLIEDVLSASQIEAGAARLHRAPLRVDQSLRQAVQEVQAAADAKSLELALKIPSKVPPVLGDRHRLHQVWMNLIGNAIKYTPTGGSITVDLAVEAPVLRVRVSDTGIGVAAECHEKIFEKFFRVADPQVEAEQGTGLGLAITRDIVRIHGGSIRVESAAGAGSTFIVELPLAREAERAEAKEGVDGVHSHS